MIIHEPFYQLFIAGLTPDHLIELIVVHEIRQWLIKWNVDDLIIILGRRLLRLISLDAYRIESRLLCLPLIAVYLFTLMLKLNCWHLTILILITNIVLLCITIISIQLTIFFSLETIIFIITALVI